MLPAESLRIHAVACLCLFGSAFCTAFGPGFQSVPILSWIQPTLLLVFLGRTCKESAKITVGWMSLAVAVQASAATFAFARIFAADKGDFLISGGLVFGICIVLYAAMIGLCYIPYLLLRSRFVVEGTKDVYSAEGIVGYRPCLNGFVPLVLPTTISALYFILTFTPLGDMSDFVYSQLDNASLIQVSSLFGITFIRMLMIWFATLLYDLLDSKTLHPIAVSHATYFSVIFIVVLTFGGLSNVVYGGNFYQTPIQYTIPEKIDVTCLIGGEWTDMIENTQRVAASGSKIVLWSESALATPPLSSANTTELHRQLGLIASTYQTYIGATYLQWVNDSKTDREDKVWNTFVLIDENGAVNLTYHKAHPVPGIEANVEAGPAELLWTDTKYGRMGVAICFDLNYPTFIGQAGRNDVDILLQPSWTWGPLGKYHARQNSVRAVEQGFHLFRCSSFGYSGVFAPNYETLAFDGMTSHGQLTTKLPIMPRRTTLYGAIGDMMSWLCVIFSVFYWFLCLPKQYSHNGLSSKVVAVLATRSNKDHFRHRLTYFIILCVLTLIFFLI